MDRFTGLIGIVTILLVAWALSRDRSRIQWRPVLWGLVFQVLLGAAVIWWETGAAAVTWVSDRIASLTSYSDAGAQMVYGWLAGPQDDLGKATGLPIHGILFAFKVMPIVIFICSIFAILYHLGVMQRVVQASAYVMTRFMRVSGAESLAVAANVFMGQTEAPILVAPYVKTMTRSELLTVMGAGMATVSGSVMLAYANMGIPMRYLITASVMAAPAIVVVTKLLFPETGDPVTAGTVRTKIEKEHANVIEAAAVGASQGMTLVLNILAMLIAFVALIALFDGILGWVGAIVGLPDLSLRTIFGFLLWPLAWVLGVPAADCGRVAELIGYKTTVNEFVAYAEMGKMTGWTAEKSRLIASFALCGFANIASIGIQIGGIGALAPTRRSDIAKLGLWALLAGTMTNLMTAAIAGIFLG